MQVQGFKDIIVQEFKDDVTFVKDVMPVMCMTGVFKGYYEVFSKPLEKEMTDHLVKFSAGMGILFFALSLIKMNSYFSRSTEEKVILEKKSFEEIYKENLFLRGLVNQKSSHHRGNLYPNDFTT